jgi:hypothetical protein
MRRRALRHTRLGQIAIPLEFADLDWRRAKPAEIAGGSIKGGGDCSATPIIAHKSGPEQVSLLAAMAYPNPCRDELLSDSCCEGCDIEKLHLRSGGVRGVLL